MSFSVPGWQREAPASSRLTAAPTRTGRPHYKHTLAHHSRWSDHRCAHGRYSHTHMQKTLHALTCLLSGLFQTHTHRHRILHIAPLAPSNPPPCSKQPPSGLVRANPAVDSAAPIAAPPPLRVVREMKALGVHYKTTTAAAGDRPPGATNYPCSSLHPHLFPLCPSISQPPGPPRCLRHTPLSHSFFGPPRRTCFFFFFYNTKHSRWIKLNIDLKYYNTTS